jgi:DNA-directed RNA polymerase subunit RPC12/RpoP
MAWDLKAKEIIKKEYGNSKNFITPSVIGYGFVSDNVAYEISKGKGIMGGEIIGLSIAKQRPDGTTERLHEYYDYFETSCKQQFALRAGSLKENNYYYCPYCGLDIKED